MVLWKSARCNPYRFSRILTLLFIDILCHRSSGQTQGLQVFRVFTPSGAALEMAAETESDMMEWMQKIRECATDMENQVSLKNRNLLTFMSNKCD